MLMNMILLTGEFYIDNHSARASCSLSPSSSTNGPQSESESCVVCSFCRVFRGRHQEGPREDEEGRARGVTTAADAQPADVSHLSTEAAERAY